MIYISHRGNTAGKNINMENHPDFISKAIEKGFDVVTAGHKFDKKFVNRFYEILSNHKYATSNAYGSHVPYSIEMGLPFFILKNASAAFEF